MRIDDLYPGAPHLRERLPERFWSKVDVRGDDECWPWLASVTPRKKHRPGGHGRFGIDRNRYTGAHRIAYMLTRGEVDDELAVCHSCDNPGCCNPAHLWEGTWLENNADRDRKGRRRGACWPASASAKLDGPSVAAIRSKLASGATKAAIAREYGIGWTTVQALEQRRTWKHIGTDGAPMVEVVA